MSWPRSGAAPNCILCQVVPTRDPRIAAYPDRGAFRIAKKRCGTRRALTGIFVRHAKIQRAPRASSMWARVATTVLVASLATGGCGSQEGGADGLDASAGAFDGAANSDVVSDGSVGADADVKGSDAGEPQDAGCPATAPVPGSPCPAVGTQCLYGSICCGGGYRCSAAGSWQVIAAGCACPAPEPDAGLPDASASEGGTPDGGLSCGSTRCNPGWTCCGPPECAVCIPPNGGICAPTCDGGPRIGDGGDGGSSTDGGGCQSNGDCGVGALCVAFVSTIGPRSMTTFSCESNPCGQAQLSCSCAASLCSGFGAGICTVTGDQVQCSNGGR